MSQPEKVFPAPPAASPAGGAGGNPLASLRRIDTKVWAAGGALVVVVLALTVGRSGDPESDPDATGTDYELDTRDTDLYNDLQPELENIGDQLEDLRNEPKWPKPVRPTAGMPHVNHPGPKPNGSGGSNSVSRTYRVKQGDTLGEIAKKFKVRGGRARLYRVNRKIIVRAAKEHKDPKPGTSMKLHAGTILVIP